MLPDNTICLLNFIGRTLELSQIMKILSSPILNFLSFQFPEKVYCIPADRNDT
jgi:hypothetical protein